jgi:nucleotide-binding universal stress UspA family protein
MSFVKILSCMTGSSRDTTALATAFAAAAPFGAHVAALYVRPNPADTMPFFPEGISANTLQDIIDTTVEATKTAAANARSAWKAVAADFRVQTTERAEKRECVTTSYQEAEGRLSMCLAEATKLSDLTVFPAIMADDWPELNEAFESVLMKTERPVLLSAHVAPKNMLHKVAIGWDGSFAAAHALNMALPYLARAEEIEVFTIHHAPLEPDVNKELKDYLGLRGLTFTMRLVDPGDRTPGQALLDVAGESMADILVMGGYGHSRMREVLFGGVTRHVVSHPRMPVFMVH